MHVANGWLFQALNVNDMSSLMNARGRSQLLATWWDKWALTLHHSTSQQHGSSHAGEFRTGGLSRAHPSIDSDHWRCNTGIGTASHRVPPPASLAMWRLCEPEVEVLGRHAHAMSCASVFA